MNNNEDKTDWLDLADAIELLRDQIAEAQDRLVADGDKGVLFSLGEVTLELGLELTQTRGMDGGFRFSVLSFGGKKEGVSKGANKITIRLSPRLPEGGDVDISDEE